MIYAPFWTVNNFKYDNQFFAWINAKKQNTYPEFHFFEESYDLLDWTKEPKTSWYDLCVHRCQQLRDKYKTLSLLYSAGRDSDHILQLFYTSGIKLDQIILLEYINNSERMQQLRDYIIPRTKLFLQQYPETRVLSFRIDEDLYKKYFTDDWLEKSNTSLQCGYFQPTAMSYYTENLLRADPTHGVVTGADKPRIVLENNKLYSTVLDKTFEVHLSHLPNHEMFYFTPDLPELHLKQSWLTVNHLLTNHLDKLNAEFLIEYCGNSHSVYYDDFCIACGRGPGWNPNLSIQNGTSKYKLSGREPWFQKLLQRALDNKWSSALNFTYAMSYIGNNYTDIFNKGDPYLGTIGVYGKKYFMKELFRA